MSSAIRDLDNEHETIADERIGGIREGMTAATEHGTHALRFAAVNPPRKQPKAGFGRSTVNFGYDRQARLAAAPDRDAFFADRQSAFARIVPARVPCFERPGLAR